MRFKATEDQIKKLAAIAAQASRPAGLGMFHYDANTEFVPEGFELTDFGLSLDYIQGRMVKISIARVGEDLWETRGMTERPREDYQSWVHKYPTFKDLLKAAGIEDSEDQDYDKEPDTRFDRRAQV